MKNTFSKSILWDGWHFNTLQIPKMLLPEGQVDSHTCFCIQSVMIASVMGTSHLGKSPRRLTRQKTSSRSNKRQVTP